MSKNMDHAFKEGKTLLLCHTLYVCAGPNAYEKKKENPDELNEAARDPEPLDEPGAFLAELHKYQVVILSNKSDVIDPRGRLIVVVNLFTHSYVCLSVRCHFWKSRKIIKPLSSENSDRNWRNCGPGRVDHWCHTYLVYFGFAWCSIFIPAIKILWYESFFRDTITGRSTLNLVLATSLLREMRPDIRLLAAGFSGAVSSHCTQNRTYRDSRIILTCPFQCPSKNS